MGSIVDSHVLDALKKEPALSKADVLTPGMPGYLDSLKRWSDTCEKQAGAVVKVTNPDEVTAVLKFARANRVPVVVHSSGHSTTGSSSTEGGIVIDLTKMRAVTVNPEAKTIAVQGGCRWEDVDVAAAKHGLATVGGTVNHTGVGGLTLGGGYGWLSGRYGLTIDCLVGVKMVLADGSQVVASEKENPDLFWAVRGAGHNFGVVTEFTFQAYEQKNPVFAGVVVFTPDKLPGVVDFANKLHELSDGDQCMVWGFSAPPPAGQTVVLASIFHNGTEEEGKKFFADLFALEPVVNTTAMMPYEQLNSILNPNSTYGGRKMFGGGNVKMPLSIPFVQDVFDTFDEFVKSHQNVNESLCLFEMMPYQKIAAVPQDAMAFANRGHYYNAATCTRWYDAKQDEVCKNFSKSLGRKMSLAGGIEASKDGEKENGVGIYSNYLPSNEIRSRDVYGINTARVKELKQKYDPDNVFRKFHNLLPTPAA